MAKEEALKFEGKVIDTYPNATFLVDVENGHKILGHISGKMRMHNVKVLLGDSVDIEVSPYDLTRGRIIYRRLGN